MTKAGYINVSFDQEQRDQIVEMASEGMSEFDIARHFGVTKRMLQYRGRKALNEGYTLAIEKGIDVDKKIVAARGVELTNEQIFQIEEMAKIGLSVRDIARIMDMAPGTMHDNYQDAIDVGRAKGYMEVTKSAFEMAVDKDHPTVTTFFLKAKCGWKEATQIEFPDENGVPQSIIGPSTTINISTEKLQAIIAVLNEKV
jgi:transposase-like protein